MKFAAVVLIAAMLYCRKIDYTPKYYTCIQKIYVPARDGSGITVGPVIGPKGGGVSVGVVVIHEDDKWILVWRGEGDVVFHTEVDLKEWATTKEGDRGLFSGERRI